MLVLGGKKEEDEGKEKKEEEQCHVLFSGEKIYFFDNGKIQGAGIC